MKTFILHFVYGSLNIFRNYEAFLQDLLTVLEENESFLDTKFRIARKSLRNVSSVLHGYQKVLHLYPVARGLQQYVYYISIYNYIYNTILDPCRYNYL